MAVIIADGNKEGSRFPTHTGISGQLMHLNSCPRGGSLPAALICQRRAIMNSSHRMAALGGLGTLCALLTVGCGQPVREDRAATFSADNRAGFQHGREGMFIDDPAGGPPLCIFKPGPEILALSSPLWAADGRKLIFTTAQPVGGPSNAGPQLPAEPRAAGTLHFQRARRYTC